MFEKITAEDIVRALSPTGKLKAMTRIILSSNISSNEKSIEMKKIIFSILEEFPIKTISEQEECNIISIPYSQHTYILHKFITIWQKDNNLKNRPVNLSNINLYNIALRHNVFENIDFTNANLFKLQSLNGKIRHSNFSNCNLTKAKLHIFSFQSSNFTNANLTLTSLKDCNLTLANFTNANLTMANLNKSNLLGANLTNANLNLTNFIDAYHVPDLTNNQKEQAILSKENLIAKLSIFTDLPANQISLDLFSKLPYLYSLAESYQETENIRKDIKDKYRILISYEKVNEYFKINREFSKIKHNIFLTSDLLNIINIYTIEQFTKNDLYILNKKAQLFKLLEENNLEDITRYILENYDIDNFFSTIILIYENILPSIENAIQAHIEKSNHIVDPYVIQMQKYCYNARKLLPDCKIQEAKQNIKNEPSHINDTYEYESKGANSDILNRAIRQSRNDYNHHNR